MKAEPARVWIGSLSPLKWERALSGDGAFLTLGSDSVGEALIRSVLSIEPDFLLLEDALVGIDGFQVLDELGKSMVCPPRVLFLCAQKDPMWLHLALEKGADRAVPGDAAPDALLGLAKETSSLPLPRLAQPMEEARLAIAGKLLSALGMREGLKGKRHIQSACAALACAPQMKYGLSARLYPYLAKIHFTTPSAVEKAVRTAVEDTWLRGNLQSIHALFGFSVDAERGKPTNAEFLNMLSEHVKRETAILLDKQSHSQEL